MGLMRKRWLVVRDGGSREAELDIRVVFKRVDQSFIVKSLIDCWIDITEAESEMELIHASARCDNDQV